MSSNHVGKVPSAFNDLNTGNLKGALRGEKYRESVSQLVLKSLEKRS